MKPRRHHLIVLDETRRVTYTLQTPPPTEFPLTKRITVQPNQKQVLLYDQKEITSKHYLFFLKNELKVVACPHEEIENPLLLPVSFSIDNTNIIPAISLTRPFSTETMIECSYTV